MTAEPAIILVEPQLAENIGAAARAMANFGLSDLRLVNPRDEWPNDKARANAAGADHVIDGARVYGTLEEALTGLTFVYATTARSREITKPVVGPHEAAAGAQARIAAGGAVGVLYGRERSGLTNEHISLADEIVTLPVNPAFSSLNIAQAVLIFAYEWRLASVGDGLPFGGEVREQAPREQLVGMFEHLEAALDEAGFFRHSEKRPHITLVIRNFLQRAQLSEQEVRTLRGMIAALERRPTRPHTGADGEQTTERAKS
ncbi:MAG TPA: RNA methyltransferase [Bauldia sp.]|nr:RNA methyltransferase [Bauldia sp.]